VVNISLNIAGTAADIKAGFLVTGIFPYNRDAFPDEESLQFYVRNRPAPLKNTEAPDVNNGKPSLDESLESRPSNSHPPEAVISTIRVCLPNCAMTQVRLYRQM
jgi:hypothetical protein